MQQKLSVEEICQKLKPVFGKRIDEIYLRYAMADSLEEKSEIEQVLNALYQKHLSELLGKSILLEPPSENDVQGEYPLAVVSYAAKRLFTFSLREHDWIRHVCISGMSGSGKTTLAFHIINNFIEKDKSFLIFDWKKSFRPLLLLDGSIMCFTIGNDMISNFLKININKPPKNVSPKEWINVICDLITESFFASYGVHKILLETLDEAFTEAGIYNGSGRYPTWFEIKRRLEDKEQKKKGREASWLMSALRIAHIMTFGSFGKAINYKGKDALTIEELLSKKVLFELNALGNIEKKFFCEFILTYIYKLKKATQQGLNENFDMAIVVDEAHNVFLKERPTFVKETVTDMVYREMREYGIGLICLDQHISKISDTVVGNSATHVAFQQQLPQDIESVAGLMQLKDRKQFFSMLPVGSAIVKLSERYTQPFLIEVAPAKIRSEIVSDEEIAKRMKGLSTWIGLEKGSDSEFAKAVFQENKPSSRLEHKEVEIQKPASFASLVSMRPTLLKEAMQIAQGREIEKDEEDLEIEQETGEEEFEEEAEKKGKESIKVEHIIEDVIKRSEEKARMKKELTPSQQVLYDYAQKKLSQGHDLKYIENTLEKHVKRGDYTLKDVYRVISYILERELSRQKSEESEKSIELTNNQRVLYDFIKQKLDEGEHIETIKYMIRDFVEERGFYTKEDIEKAVEHAIENDIRILPKGDEHDREAIYAKYPEKQNVFKDNVLSNINKADKEKESQALDEEEKRFLLFLRENKNKGFNTTEIYNALGLSARRGNKCKNELMDKGLVRVEEIKNSKGWKKVIKLA